VGKGRKHRGTPLRRDAVAALEDWLRTHPGAPGDPLFPGIRGRSLSRDAIERLVTRYACAAAERCASLKGKRVSPHVLRHGTAMELLRHGVDRSVIALWLGHESVETTQMYLHADLRLKEEALSHTTPLLVKPSRYKPSDQLLAFLEAL
jgi:integrase